MLIVGRSWTLPLSVTMKDRSTAKVNVLMVGLHGNRITMQVAMPRTMGQREWVMAREQGH